MGTHPPPEKNRFGMGWGDGLLGEAFFIADMVSDPGSYDVGFGDADGFDFWEFFFPPW